MRTRPNVIFLVVISLAIVVLAGMLGVYSLILAKSDAALIAILSGHVGTALGALTSILSNTSSAHGSEIPAPLALAEGTGSVDVHMDAAPAQSPVNVHMEGPVTQIPKQED